MSRTDDDGTDGADGRAAEREEGEDPLADVPDWDDEYLDRVSGNLMHSYDLERDHAAGGERFELYGELRITSQKQFLHPALSYAQHDAREHLFVRRDRPTVREFERLVDLGHDLADDWIEADEEHFSTDFTFVLVGEYGDDVRSFVEGFRDRTLLKYGYYGHYEVNVAAVDPERERAVGSENVDVVDAFVLWGRDEERDGKTGVLGRLRGLF